MKTLLLTGFGPFAAHEINPTEELVRAFHNTSLNNYKIVSHILPVEYDNSIQKLNNLIEEFNPNVVISFGLAADRNKVTPELVAINYQHSNTQDNAGMIRKFKKINPTGKESFFTTLPLENILRHLDKADIPASLSTTAGTYVCNTVMYSGLKKIQQDKRDCISGFIHIPNTLTTEQLKTALIACINSL